MATLKGKTAVVTGGSRGIGRGIVERLAQDGAEVVFNYASSTEAAEEVLRAVEKAGGTARAERLDLAEAGAARHMPDGGRIVNISTLNTQRAGRGIAPYMMSKGALEQLTAAAAVDLGPRGITVNTVSPGPIDTDLLRGTNPPEALDMVVQMTPLGRLGQPSDVADVVAWLAGPDSRWITGQNIRAGGGIA